MESKMTFIFQRLFPLTSFAILSLGVAMPTYAATIENFNSWTSTGNVTNVGSGTATLSTGSPSTEALPSPNLQNFLGVTPEALDRSLFEQAYQGSALRKTFNATAGDVLSFDLFYATTEPSITGSDYPFVIFNDQLSRLENLIGSNQATNLKLTFSSTGNQSVAFGVVDINDVNFPSTLTFSNANYTPIPTPALLPGLVALGYGAFKRKQGKAVNAE
jgi:hypothetical protein